MFEAHPKRNPDLTSFLKDTFSKTLILVQMCRMTLARRSFCIIAEDCMQPNVHFAKILEGCLKQNGHFASCLKDAGGKTLI